MRATPGLGVLAAGLLAATGAYAQTPPPDPPPADPLPPASLEPRDVLAWSDKHLDVASWRVLAINPHGLFLASPKGVTLRQDQMAEVELRHELFAPVDVGGGQMRSDLERWVVDCKHKRHALLKMTLFARNNLKEELAHRETETVNWREAAPGDEATQAIAAVCEAVAAGQRGEKAPPTSP